MNLVGEVREDRPLIRTNTRSMLVNPGTDPSQARDLEKEKLRDPSTCNGGKDRQNVINSGETFLFGAK